MVFRSELKRPTQTDAQMKAKRLSYSRSRGAFAGIALNGATLRADEDENNELSGEKLTNREIVDGDIAKPAVTSGLISTLEKLSKHEGGLHAWKEDRCPVPSCGTRSVRSDLSCALNYGCGIGQTSHRRLPLRPPDSIDLAAAFRPDSSLASSTRRAYCIDQPVKSTACVPGWNSSTKLFRLVAPLLTPPPYT